MGGQECGSGVMLPFTFEDPMMRQTAICMEGYNNRALGYVRQRLHIGIKTPIEMNMQLGEKGYSVYVFDAESFAGFCGMLSQCSVREFESARYIVHVRVEPPSKRPPPDKPRNRPVEKAFKKLAEVCYRGQHAGAMGTWTRECNHLMADREFLKQFHQQREIVRRAMGDGRYLLNPTTAICPFDGCHHARLRLNSMSYYPFLFSGSTGRGCHWRPSESSRVKAHSSNPAVPILCKRFELLAKQPHISDQDLDSKAGTVEFTNDWMASQPRDSQAGELESFRKFDEEGRAFSEMTDLFDPGDISNNLLRSQWIEKVKADWAANPTPAPPPPPTLTAQILANGAVGEGEAAVAAADEIAAARAREEVYQAGIAAARAPQVPQ